MFEKYKDKLLIAAYETATSRLYKSSFTVEDAEIICSQAEVVFPFYRGKDELEPSVHMEVEV